MSKQKKLITAALITSSLACSHLLQAREFADIYTECGLGAMIAPNNDTVAAITNVTWDLGTTAISTDVSSPENCNGGNAETASFIYESYDQIEKDIASGHGKFLDTLITLSAIDQSRAETFKKSLRQSFTQLVSKEGYSIENKFNQAEALFELVQQEKLLVSS